MKKNPIHFYWGRKNGLVVTREDAEGKHPEVIVLDPPRKGLAADVVESIAEMQPERVVYVSCDSATMARDVKRFAELGYTATRAAAVDMFPRADHIEAIVLLSRK